MYSAPFEYHAPTTVADALSLLKKHGENAKLLAGGHSLVPLMKLRLVSPPVVIDLGRVSELAGIREDASALAIGAMTTHRAVESSPIVRARAPLLAEVAAAIGDLQVRNRGTIGGSVAHADPAADWPAALLALDAECVIAGGAKPRRIAAGSFFLDMLKTALEPDEILTEVRVPFPRPGGHAYAKARQPASGFALVGIAVQLALEAGRCRHARVGVTGVGPHPYRATACENALKDRDLTGDLIASAADTVPDGQDALEDLHASAEFRAHLARVYARRALARAAGLSAS